MDKQEQLYFEALTADRMESANVLEKPSIEGVKTSATDKYSDQAHFIYELLQNADDTGATYARFELFQDKLLFVHNGKSHFSITDPMKEREDKLQGLLGDINSITSIGNSNKTDKEKPSIGKFGVGFKAVFKYTSTPHIYAENIAFKIERFIVPIKLESDFPNRIKNETIFIFPFDREDLPEKQAFDDISDKLYSLDCPLLFLSHLKNISSKILNKLGKYEKKAIKTMNFDETIAELITLMQNKKAHHNELTEDKLWLFSRKTENGYKYSVGFFLDEHNSLKPVNHRAFCFFPTKEVTNLNFIIHAPFLLNDSRETIQAEDKHNLEMIKLLAELAGDSIKYLVNIGMDKQKQLINDDIFDIIPYNKENFAETNSKSGISFMPFFDAIQRSFQANTIIPTHKGFTIKENAYWAFVPQIASLFSNEQLAMITGNEKAQWCFASLGREATLRSNKPLAEYIDSISTNWLDEDDLLKLSSTFTLSKYFIESQPIEWLHKFYKWISETKGRTDLVRKKAIFWDSNKNAVPAYDKLDNLILFLPADNSSAYTTINNELLENEDSFEFIKKFGISEPKLNDEIYNIIIPKYIDGAEIDTIPDFKKFFNYYKSCRQDEVYSFISTIKNLNFLKYSSKNTDDISRGKGEELYFPTDELKKWFEPKSDTRFICSEEYGSLVNEEDRELLKKFFIELGVSNKPKAIEIELTASEALEIKSEWKYSTRTHRWSERRLDGLSELLDYIIEKHDYNYSLMLWEKLLSEELSLTLRYIKFSAKHNYFYYSFGVEDFEATNITNLRTKSWLLNYKNEWVPPSDLTPQTINKIYDTQTIHAKTLLDILEIKETPVPIQSIIPLSDYVQSLGFSDEEVRQILQEKADEKKRAEANKRSITEELNGTIEVSSSNQSIKNVIKDLASKTGSSSKESILKQLDEIKEAEILEDEDDYIKPIVDIDKKIDKIKLNAEREIQEVAHLEDLKQKADNFDKYSYGWFKALLELETAMGTKQLSTDKGISISFAKVELEQGTERTLILKHPNRSIPHFIEDLSDIPLELYFADESPVRLAIEVASVKSYTLRVKLRASDKLKEIDLSKVIEARVEAKSPVFLLDELYRAFLALGKDKNFDDSYNLKENLCNNIEFVFGPPGTGKTTYLAKNIIHPLMDETEKLKVLVLTPTNKAADVLTKRIIESSSTSSTSCLDWLIRFGATNDIYLEESGVFRDKTFDIRTFPRNVTVTTIARFAYDYFMPSGDLRLHLKELQWDYIVIDEASMVSLVDIIYPLYKKMPKKFVIAGDPFQIEPITSIEEWKNENIYSLVDLKSFEEPQTVPHPYNVHLLTTQYRSIPEVGEVFSNFAYNGLLSHYRQSSEAKKLNFLDEIGIKALTLIKFPIRKYESVYKSKKLLNSTSYHTYSALFAFEFIKNISQKFSQAENHTSFSIGLIAPYRAQADLVQKLLTSIILPQKLEVQVGTIHGFQGDECDMMIALFNPPPYISSHKDMFLNKLNIINVSISRARDYLVILMPDSETENIEKLQLITKVELLCKLQENHQEYSTAQLEEILFDNPNFIEENSFSTSHQMVNVYRKPEKLYEVRTEETAIDVQLHDLS